MSEEKKGCLGTTGTIVAICASLAGILVSLKQIGWIAPPAQQKQEVVEQTMQTPGNSQTDLEKRLSQLEDKDRQQRENTLLKRIADLESRQKERAGSEPEYEGGYELSGDWYYPANPGAVYRIAQYGEQVTLQEISNVYGVSTVSAAGSGTISNNALVINYYTMLNTTGTASFTIGNGGRSLNGQFHDNVTGMTLPVQLQRQ